MIVSISARSDEEIRDIENITITKPVSSLRGIEHLTSLKSIELRGTNISSIDFGSNPLLEEIEWYDLNPCTTNISFSNNPHLRRVVIGSQDGRNGYNLRGLDFSKCPKLSSLYVDGDELGVKTINLTNTAYDTLDKNNDYYSVGKNAKVIRGNYDEQGVLKVKFIRYRGNYVAVRMNGQALPWEYYMNGLRTVNYNGYYLSTDNGVFDRRTGWGGYWGDYYFVNGVAPRGDTFVDDGSSYLWRITNGKRNDENGFVRYKGRYVFSYKGSAATFYTGWITYEGYRCYLQRGVLTRYYKM